VSVQASRCRSCEKGLDARAGRHGGLPAVRPSALRGRGPHHRTARAAKMFPRGRKTSAGEAGTRNARDPGRRSWAARGERSERPVAGTDAAAQADRAGRPARRLLSPSAPATFGGAQGTSRGLRGFSFQARACGSGPCRRRTGTARASGTPG
jgi:hypothetical protein